MSKKQPVAEGQRAGEADAPLRSGDAVAALNRWLMQLSVVQTTVLLTSGAVVAALLAHILIGWVLFGGISIETLITAPIVTIVVAVPVISQSASLLRRIAGSRHTLKAMTERLALALDAAEQANRAKSRFLANMSHELRTPLNAVIGFSEVMREEMLGPIGQPRYREYACDINDSGRHLLGIINDILDLAKIEAGGVEMEPESDCNLAEAIGATLRMIRPLAEKQEITIRTVLPARPVTARAVERMLRQILLNVLSNAVKFTPAGGNVSLSLSASEKTGVSIVVSDSGIGMTAEEVRIALTPFGQARNAMTASQSGTGLGLPLARAMTEIHGGTLKVASEPRRGTTVEITLPPERLTTSTAPAGEPPFPSRGRARREG